MKHKNHSYQITDDNLKSTYDVQRFYLGLFESTLVAVPVDCDTNHIDYNPHWVELKYIYQDKGVIRVAVDSLCHIYVDKYIDLIEHGATSLDEEHIQTDNLDLIDEIEENYYGFELILLPYGNW